MLCISQAGVSVPVNSVNPTIISQCRICGTDSTHMVNCANADCNEHFVLSEACGESMKGSCSEGMYGIACYTKV